MLQLFCEKLDVTDLEEVVPALQRLTVAADACSQLEQVHDQHSSNVLHLSSVKMWICVLDVFSHTKSFLRVCS